MSVTNTPSHNRTLSYSAFPSHPEMSRLGISPVRNKRPVDHQRHGSEVLQRPRPLSFVQPPPMTPQHIKRSSIYVSDASILLSHKTDVFSPTHNSTSSPSTADPFGFTDHYASLELESNASIDEVRSAFRRLRGLYFSTDAVKYRAAQAAFDVLANPAARQEYDLTYRARPVSSASSLAELVEHSKHGRKDSAHGDENPMTALVEEEEEEVEARSQDPNWALKHHRRLYEPVVGTQPYQSFVPILSAYRGWQRHPMLKSARPAYTGSIATYAMPN